MKKLLIAIIAATVLAGCVDNYKTAESANHSRKIEIDTLSIHGKKHEVLFWYGTYKGGMMHSPECWCLKGEER